MVTVLDDAAVRARLDPRAAVEAMREALTAAHRGELVAPSRVHADVLTFTAGRMPGRWYGYRSYDTHVDGEQLVVVHSEPTGQVAGVAVGSAIGAYRTGALGGVAADLLARADATTMGVIGAGRQAWTQLWAIAAVRSLTDVAVYSRDPNSRGAFAARAATQLGVPARAVDSALDAVAGRDIVVLATSSPTPVMQAAWLAPGTALTTVGPKQLGRAEFGADLPDRAALIATDSPAQLGGYHPPAVLSQAPVVHLGAIADGDHPGRADSDDITLYASVGLAGTEPFLLARLLDL